MIHEISEINNKLYVEHFEHWKFYQELKKILEKPESDQVFKYLFRIPHRDEDLEKMKLVIGFVEANAVQKLKNLDNYHKNLANLYYYNFKFDGDSPGKIKILEQAKIGGYVFKEEKKVMNAPPPPPVNTTAKRIRSITKPKTPMPIDKTALKPVFNREKALINARHNSNKMRELLLPGKQQNLFTCRLYFANETAANTLLGTSSSRMELSYFLKKAKLRI